jgi:tripartite-type tricarboxylate transporter receptor subunit TctC
MTKFTVTRRSLLGASAGGALALLAKPNLAKAASYATQPVRLFVGTAAAGTVDLVARLLSPTFRDMLGQPVLVENRPGAATTLAAGLVANAKPDGHTLLVSSSAALAVHVASATKPTHLINDLTHVGMACDGGFIYAIHKDVPAKNYTEFVALLQQQPGKFRYGATGIGGNIHLSGALFCLNTGTRMVAVQYANAGMRANELLSNQTQLGIGGLSRARSAMLSFPICPHRSNSASPACRTSQTGSLCMGRRGCLPRSCSSSARFCRWRWPSPRSCLASPPAGSSPPRARRRR